METALGEISLVFFTTIAPAGAIGFVVMALSALVTSSKSHADAVSHHLVIPLALAITGLIASATHLGTPANALYVLTGTGRSPLSNEVVAAVAFLAISGVYWIASFRDSFPKLLRRAWLVAAMASAALFVEFVSLAYSVPSIPTWNMPTAPLTLWLNSLSSGLVVGLLGLSAAQREPASKHVKLALGGAALAAIANVGVLFFEWQSLDSIATTATRATELVPFFPASVVFYAILSAAALLCAWPRIGTSEGTRRTIRLIAASALALVACFAVRFAFYSMHMTLGL